MLTNLKRFRKNAVAKGWSKICEAAEDNKTGIWEGGCVEFRFSDRAGGHFMSDGTEWFGQICDWDGQPTNHLVKIIF